MAHWPTGGHTRQVHAFGDLLAYGGTPHRRPPCEPKTADWYTEDGHRPPHTQRALNPVSDVEDVSSEYRERADAECRVTDTVQDGGRTDTSPVAARTAVAAGAGAIESLCDGGTRARRRPSIRSSSPASSGVKRRRRRPSWGGAVGLVLRWRSPPAAAGPPPSPCPVWVPGPRSPGRRR